MYSADTFIYDEKLCVVCSGEGITESLNPRRIMIGTKEYQVKEVSIVKSFIGDLQACFVVEGPQPIPLGEVVIIE